MGYKSIEENPAKIKSRRKLQIDDLFASPIDLSSAEQKRTKKSSIKWSRAE